ncbi:MAG TPA: hypothetical protein VFG30_29785, partial [Polyangiales bacterium]|nr:hypothetical protein [Polyangiales bacterium]
MDREAGSGSQKAGALALQRLVPAAALIARREVFSHLLALARVELLRRPLVQNELGEMIYVLHAVDSSFAAQRVSRSSKLPTCRL